MEKAGLSSETIDRVKSSLQGLIDTTEEQTDAINTQALSEEELLQLQLLDIGADEAEAVSTNTVTASQTAQIGVIDVLKMKYQHLAAAIGISSAALTAFIAVAAGLVIAAVVIEKIHVSAEETKEAVSKLKDEFDSAIKTANDNLKTIERLADRYDELSEGVDALGNNVRLSAEEFAEYNDIVNQIADMSPELVNGYTAEGNAILSLKGNVDELKQSYIDAQKEAYNLLIADKESSKEANILKQWQDTDSTSFWGKIKDVFSGEATAGNSISQRKAYELLTELNSMTNDEIRDYRRQLNQAYTSEEKAIDKFMWSNFDLSGDVQTSRDNSVYWELSDEKIGSIRAQARALAQSYKEEVEAALSDVESLANAYLMTHQDYSTLDEQTSNIASILVNSLSAEIADSFENNDDVYAYVDNIIQILSNLSDKEGAFKAKRALIDLFAINKENIPVNELKSQVDEYIETIAPLLEETPASLKVRLDFDDVDDIYTRARNSLAAIGNISLQMQGVPTNVRHILEKDFKYLEEYTKDFNSSQWELWLNVTNGSMSATEAIEAYEAEFAKLPQDPITFPDIFALEDAEGELNTLGKLNEELDNIQTASSGLKEAMDNYNSSGKFTIDQLQDIVSYGDEYLKYLIDENGALELNEQALQDVAKAQVQKMKVEALSNLTKTITDIQNQATAEQFLAEQLIDTAGAYQEVSKAALAAWYNEQLILGEIDKNTLDQVVAEAERMWTGIEEIFDKVDFSFSDSVADDADLLEKEINYLEAQFNAGMISYIDFLTKRKDLLDDYYDKGKIKADQYYQYIKELHESEISIYDKALSAVNRKIQDQIDLLEKQKEDLEESYQLRIDVIQSEIDKLTEANKEREDQIALEKALYDLQEAKRNRDKKLFNGEQFIYTSDPGEIRDAQEEVYNKEFEKNIQRLEKEIESLEKELEDASKAIDNQIDDLQKYADEWGKIADVYEQTQEDMVAAQIWGTNWEKDLFNDRIGNLNDFKDKYIAAQKAMEEATLNLAKAQAQAGTGGSGSGSGGGNNSTTTPSESIKELALKQQIADYELQIRQLGVEYNNAAGTRADASTLQTINGKIVQAQEALKRKQKELEELQKNKYHTGLDRGYVGSDRFSADKRLNILQVVGNGLRPNEELGILQKKELVLTEEQQKNIVDALLNKPVDTNKFKQRNFLPQIDSMRNTSEGFNFSIGEINLHEVDDVDTLARAIVTQLPNKVRQNCSKR